MFGHAHRVGHVAAIDMHQAAQDIDVHTDGTRRAVEAEVKVSGSLTYVTRPSSVVSACPLPLPSYVPLKVKLLGALALGSGLLSCQARVASRGSSQSQRPPRVTPAARRSAPYRLTVSLAASHQQDPMGPVMGTAVAVVSSIAPAAGRHQCAQCQRAPPEQQAPRSPGFHEKPSLLLLSVVSTRRSTET